MIRKPRNQRYTIKATYIENEVEHVFWCKENKLRNITNEMGASLPLSNGERMLETDSKLEFKIHQGVKILNEKLLINNINSNVDPNDLNALRGRPSYVTTLLVK